MMTAQAQLELALVKYDGLRLSAIRLHNACPNNLPWLRDTLWQSVQLYEEFCSTLQTCLMACVEEQTSNATISVFAHSGTSQNER